jgi:hypothetical protein
VPTTIRPQQKSQAKKTMEKQPTTSKPGALPRKLFGKNLSSDDHFDRSFSFIAMEGKLRNQRKEEP